MKEKSKAIELQKKNSMSVLPIILSPCGWLDDNDLSTILALPNDGRPISQHSDQEDAWHYIYNKINILANKIKNLKQININSDFVGFLNDAEMLKKGHSAKESVYLDDIFIYPELDQYDDIKEFEETVRAEKLIENYFLYNKIAIAGAEQSGKTTLCKIFFKSLFEKGLIPVYLLGNKIASTGKIDFRIQKLLSEQYDYKDLDDLHLLYKRIVPIIDDFHLT